MSERGRDWCWQHLKSMWILCHCILSAQPLASTASQHSSCCSPSPSLSERISHPLLLQLLTASFLTSIPFLRFYPTFQLLPCSSSHFLHFLSFLFPYRFFLRWTFNAWFPCPIKSCFIAAGTSSLHPTRILLICREGWVKKCELNSSAFKAWLRQPVNVSVKEVG